MPITFDSLSTSRPVTPKTVTAGAEAGSSRTAPAGDGFGRLVQALSGQPDQSAGDETNAVPAPPVHPIAHTVRALVARIQWPSFPIESGPGGEVVVPPVKLPDRMPPDEVVVDVLEVDAEDQSPLDIIVLVDPIIKTLTDIYGNETSDAKTTGKVEDDLAPAGTEGLSTKPAPPVKQPPLNPDSKDDQGETPGPAEPDRNTKLPPLATGKNEFDPRRVDGSPAPRATDAPTAADIAALTADDTTPQPAVPTRASAATVAARVAADSAFSASAAARSTADVPAATTGAFSEVSARVAAGVTAENVPQTSDARRADDARLAADRVLAFSRTSPRVSLNDLATADRVERPASSIFDARTASDARPAADRAYATVAVPMPVPSAYSAVVSNVTITSTLERESASVATQIVDSIRLQWTRGGGEAQVTLEPKYLGPLTVNVRIDRDVVSATVIAETPAVREWLRANEALLRQGLSDQGLRLDRLEIAEPAAETPRDHQESHDRSHGRDEQPRQPKRHDAEGAVFNVVA